MDCFFLKSRMTFEYANAQLEGKYVRINTLYNYTRDDHAYTTGLEWDSNQEATNGTSTEVATIPPNSLSGSTLTFSTVLLATHGIIDDVDGRNIRGNMYAVNLDLRSIAHLFNVPRYIYMAVWYDIRDNKNDNRAYDGIRVHSWDIGRLAVQHTSRWFAGRLGVNNPTVIAMGVAIMNQALARIPVKLVLKHQTTEDSDWAKAEHHFTISLMIYDASYDISTEIKWGDRSSPLPESGPSSWGSLGEDYP